MSVTHSRAIFNFRTMNSILFYFKILISILNSLEWCGFVVFQCKSYSISLKRSSIASNWLWCFDVLVNWFLWWIKYPEWSWFIKCVTHLIESNQPSNMFEATDFFYDMWILISFSFFSHTRESIFLFIEKLLTGKKRKFLPFSCVDDNTMDIIVWKQYFICDEHQ